MSKRTLFEKQTLPQLEHLHRAARFMVNTEFEAQALVVESFGIAYRAWPDYKGDSDIRTWVFGIMTRVLNDKYRLTFRRSAATSLVDERDGYMMHSQPVHQQSFNDLANMFPLDTSEIDIRETILSLPDDLRQIVVLSLLEGFSYQEIATITGLDRESVKSGLHHGRTLVERELLDPVNCDGTYDLPAGRVRSSRMRL